MKRRLFHYAVILRACSLLMGCATTTPAAQDHTPRVIVDKNGPAPTSRARIVKEEERPADQRLKGKGTTTEHASQQVTAKKMASFDVTADRVLAVMPLVEQAALDNGLPQRLILGVIWVESRFNPEATSPVGAMGLMQLMPRTASYLADCIKWEGPVDPYDPAFNIAAGSYYVARLIRQFGGDWDLALAAYNAGPGNVAKWMKNTGLPEVSIEYYSMVQTAMNYFGGEEADVTVPDERAVVPSDTDLDKLGLAILISGLSSDGFGLLRTDDADPFSRLPQLN